MQDAVFWLVLIAAPAQNLFVLTYGLGSPWWRSLVGRGLFTKALGLALLIDLVLLYQWFGDDYPFRDAIRFAVYLLIASGAWLQYLALLNERREARRVRRDARS